VCFVNKEIRILYLEDVAMDADRVSRELQKSGLDFRCERVETREAFVRELEQSPDLILSDHGVPSFDGLTALGVARKIRPDIPFIFVTNALSREMEIEKLTGGVTDYVRKAQLHYLPVAVLHALREADERRDLKHRFKGIPDKRSLGSHLLPICSHCKKIRTRQNQWIAPEVFFHSLLHIDFTHGLCPDCTPKFFGEAGGEST